MFSLRLFCGHVITDALFGMMYRARIVRCPHCGTEWRGYQVINHDKAQQKKDLYFAIRLGERSRKR